MIKNKNKKLVVKGGIPLKGIVKISPSKNAILPLIAIALITEDTLVIPVLDILDFHNQLKILEAIGYTIETKRLVVEITPIKELSKDMVLPWEVVESLRASILFLGPLLGRNKKVAINFPGGDNFQRKLNFHFQCLEKMGGEIFLENNIIYGSLGKEGFTSMEYSFEKPSVGGTQHMILSAILGKKGDKFIFNNCAQEPESKFLIDIIRQLGGSIEVIGSKVIVIGNGKLLKTQKKHNIKVIQDRIEALTYLTIALATKGTITIDMDNPLEIIGGKDLNLLTVTGSELIIEKSFITIKAKDNKLESVKYFQCGEYPEVSTDFCPIFSSLMGITNGTSIFTETIYGDNRFKYIAEIKKLGGVFRYHHHKPHTIVIDGSKYTPGEVLCTDIRGGMALLIGALSACGTSILYNVDHLFRGYEFFIEKIKSLGGNINLLNN